MVNAPHRLARNSNKLPRGMWRAIPARHREPPHLTQLQRLVVAHLAEFP